MKVIFAIGFVICLLGCETKAPVSLGSFSAIDGASKLEVEVPQLVEQVDTLVDVLVDLPLVEVKIDTSTLEGKRDHLLREFNLANGPVGAIYDTIIDLNFDAQLDFIIGTHSQSGNGYRTGIEVFIYTTDCSCYLIDSVLSNMRNPSFYFAEKKISSFYISYGSGSGEEFEWIDGEWTQTKYMEMINHGNSTVWKVSDLLTGTDKKVALPYQSAPPLEVLKTNFTNYE
ncbi:MAG: hypothetical protein ACJASQ_000445 [Crocinitomicaceae bacterium]|jgi:hypothetical protein